MLWQTDMKRAIIITFLIVILSSTIFLIRKTLPFRDGTELLPDTITVDSIWTLGPAAAIYDKSARKYFWLKSYTSFDMKALDSLKSRNVSIMYMKSFMGPLENRITHMEVNSVVVFDQPVEAK